MPEKQLPIVDELKHARIDALVREAKRADRDWAIIENQWFVSAPRGALDEARIERLPGA